MGTLPIKQFIYIVEEYESSDYCGIANAKGMIGAYKERTTAELMAKQMRKKTVIIQG